MLANGFHLRLVATVAVLSSSACTQERPPTATPETTQAKGGSQMRLTSSAFASGEAIPKKYTGEGEDVSPPLAWRDPPAGTQSFALMCDDPDAPSAEPWVHWVIYNVGPEVNSLPEGIKAGQPEITAPVEAKQGKNSWGSGVQIGYRGPMPPPGHGTHHYHFKLYALDTKLDLAPSTTKKQLMDAMKGHVLAEAELVGTYER
jgi:Raf kinase inhibitor-like YbhB/YbcL family protein